jgi:hypothetical protein
MCKTLIPVPNPPSSVPLSATVGQSSGDASGGLPLPMLAEGCAGLRRSATMRPGRREKGQELPCCAPTALVVGGCGRPAVGSVKLHALAT